MGSGSSPRWGIEYPLASDAPNIPGDLEGAVDDIDTLLFSLSIVSETANYAAQMGQFVKMTGTHTVTSPAAAANIPWGAANAGGVVTVVPASGLLLLPGDYGASSLVLPNQGDFALFQCDGTNHNLIAGSAAVILPNGVSLASLAQSGATTGQLAQWNGTEWAPVTYSAGAPGTTVESFLGSQIDHGGITPVNIASVSLGPGTWLILAKALLASDYEGINMGIWIGPNSASPTGAYCGADVWANAQGDTTDSPIHLSKSVTLTVTTTVYLTAQFGSSNGGFVNAVSAGNTGSIPNASGITAVRTA